MEINKLSSFTLGQVLFLGIKLLEIMIFFVKASSDSFKLKIQFSKKIIIFRCLRSFQERELESYRFSNHVNEMTFPPLIRLSKTCSYNVPSNRVEMTGYQIG